MHCRMLHRRIRNFFRRYNRDRLPQSTMNRITSYIFAASLLFFIGCDVQSGITKKSVEKYEPTPTPVKTATVIENIDPADVVAADTNADGPTISINPSDTKTSLNCAKYNQAMINVDRKSIKVTGVCKELMINGDGNSITLEAAAAIVINGHQNTIEYSKYVNGK